MDFNKFNARAVAETGKRMPLLDPWTGEVMTSEAGPCAVIVRGTSSRTAQETMRQKQRAAALKIKSDAELKVEPDVQIMEDVHAELCENAAAFIIGFENVENGDKPATLEDVPWFLDLTFPEMAQKSNADGSLVFGEDGQPVFEMRNNPFAKQVITFAATEANKLGNSSPV